MTWELIIPVIAAGLVLVGVLFELLTHDREKAKKIEFAIARKQREVKKHSKDKDNKAMMTAQKELMGLMGQNFRLRMKTMFISFPLFIVAFWMLSGMLNLAPLQAGAVSQVGLDVRNLEMSPQNLSVELVSAEVQISGTNARSFMLDDKGDQGDRQQVWWNVTADAGQKVYAIKFTSRNNSEEKSYAVKFSSGELTAGFSPAPATQVLSGSFSVAPLYKPIEISIFGMNLAWIWWYLISFMVLSAILSPVKNKVLWGHHKGIKHLEKMETMKETGISE